MIRRMVLLAVCALAITACFSTNDAHAQQRAFGQSWGGGLKWNDWERFLHYPYVYYPHNYTGSHHFRSRDSLYYRYPTEMRVPVYNRKWQNYYPSPRPYHSGHHFILDVF